MRIDEIFDLELYVFSGPGNGCDEAAIVITVVQVPRAPEGCETTVQKGPESCATSRLPASFELHLWQKEMSDEYTQTDILQLTDNQWGYLHGRAEAWYAELFSAPTRRG